MCVCWHSVPGEQGSEAEGKGSFGFHGRPVGEKTPQTGFQAPRAQILTPPPVANQRTPEMLRCSEALSFLLLCPPVLIKNQAWAEPAPERITKSVK